MSFALKHSYTPLRLGRLVSKWELADMQARLYLNLGVVKEHTHEVDDAISYYETAINICKSNDLFELHHQCLIAFGLSYSTRNEAGTALNIFNSAIEVSKRIHDKHEKMCEALLAKSTLLVNNGDYQSAKQVLKKAYKLKTPNASDNELIQKNLKVILMLCKCEDELVITNSFHYAKRKELLEKLGDGSCKMKNYSKAIDFYLKMLEAAQLDGDEERKLIPIYVSLYQTYIDNKQYDEALEFMNKEYELIKEESKEACATLLGLGNLLDLGGKDFWEVDSMYRKALEEARKADDRAMERTVMIKLIKFTRKRNMISLVEILEQEAQEKAIDLLESNEETDYSEDIPDLSEDLGNLSLELSSDPESEDNEAPKPVTSSTRKKRSAISVKKNAKGETRLHEACISGNYQLAKLLIDQGHAINVRDNAGWLPLHEAAIHGFREIAELLLDNGAQSAINDKGGTSCDGITPLYDAASNGNLNVVQLFLDRGAKATVKTDFDETPYDALIRWNTDYGDKLSPTEKEFYEEIKRRLMEQCEKVGIDTTGKKPNTGSSGYLSGKSRNSQASQHRSQQRTNMRYNTSFSDESDKEEATKELEDSVKKNARNEYKNVMSRLKNPHQNQQINPLDDGKKRPAHLTVQEVDSEEWLIDDLGPTRKKQKFFNENNLESRSPVKASTSFTTKTSSVFIESESDSDIENVGADAFELVMNANSSKFKPIRRSLTQKQQSRAKAQPSLIDAGFVRFIEPADLREAPQDPPLNNSSLNSSLNRSTVAEKQIIIKVQIEDERVIVPVVKEATSELKISWLIEEAARRYYW